MNEGKGAIMSRCCKEWRTTGIILIIQSAELGQICTATVLYLYIVYRQNAAQAKCCTQYNMYRYRAVVSSMCAGRMLYPVHSVHAQYSTQYTANY